MNSAPDLDIDAYRRRLEALASELQSVAESGAEAARPVELDQSRVGRVSRMDAMQSQAMSAEGERRRAQELGRIRAALERIDKGEFGECQRCGEPIAGARLDADPAARLCIDCAEAAERRGG